MLCVDLHAAQIQGFFNVPFDHLFALPVFLEDYLRATFDQHAVFVSPDAGGVERARAYSKRLGASLAIIDKRRARANESEVMHLIGDVKDRECIIVDDLIDTGGERAAAIAGLTVSVGGTTLRRGGVDDLQVALVIADTALYVAKRDGGGRAHQIASATALGDL